MLKTYKFKCCCEACTNNYKMFGPDAPFTDRSFVQKFPKDEVGLLMTRRDLALTSKFYGRACKYMEQHGIENYSVREIHVMYFTMLRCLTVAVQCRDYLI